MKEGIDGDMGAKHAKWFVTSAKTTGWLRETELVPKTQGVVSSIKEMKFAMGLLKHGKVPLPFPPHVAEDVKESRALYDLVKEQGRDGALGIVQGEQRCRSARHRARRTARAGAEAATRRGAEKGRLLQGLPRLAVGEGARHLDAGARAEGRPRADRARGGHVLRRRRHPRGRAGLLPAPERAHPRLRGGDRLRHADDGLQRLHAQPAPGELPAAGRRGAARARQREPRRGRRARVHRRRRRRHLLWLIAEGEGYELLKTAAHKGLKGLKMAPFYGCQILRPSKLLGFEDPDRPSSLERIIEACGGEAIDYPAKIKCCGFPIIQAREETALGELIQPIEQAKEAGADAIVTPCPLCHLSLDAWQSKLKKQTGQGLPDADPAPLAADRRRRRARGVGAEVQAARRLGGAGSREARRLSLVRSGPAARASGTLGGRVSWTRTRWGRACVLAGAARGGGAPVRLVRGGLAADARARRPGRGPAGRARRAPDRASLRLPPRPAVARRRRRRRAADWVRERKPDLVCVTGDLLSHPRGEPRSTRLLPASAAYVVLGNHDLAVTRDPFSRRSSSTGSRDRCSATRRDGRAPRRSGSSSSASRPRPTRRRCRPRRSGRRAADPAHALSARLRPPGYELVLAGHMHAGQIVLPYPGGKLRLAHRRARQTEGVYRAGGRRCTSRRGSARRSYRSGSSRGRRRRSSF